MNHKNNKLESINFKQLIETEPQNFLKAQSVIYDKKCIVGHNIAMEHLSEFHLLQQPTRMNVLMFCLCLKGNSIMQCDMQQSEIKENSLFVCKPGSIIQPIERGAQLVSVLIIDSQYQLSASSSIQKLLPHYDSLEKITAIELEPSESKRLNTLIGYLYENIKGDSEQLFYHESVKALITTLTYEVLRYFTRNLTNEAYNNPKNFTRQQAYFHDFANLLGLHFREERRVEYYADRLHITPKYLGTLVMQHTGRSASHWISSYVMSEARALLCNTAMSIQEIAFSLNFANQSFFGKYFKAHQGVTPGEYRRQQMKI